MKTIVVCATIFCLELVSSFPYPEPLPGYYDTYEQVPQQIQLPNIARSPELYHRQQLAYLQHQTENIRRQNYENLLRNQDVNQRLSSQVLPRPSYNIQPVLNTVREPYVNSIPLQRPIQQAHYETPITQSYYPLQSFQQPIRPYQPEQNQQYEETRSEAKGESGTQAQINNAYPQQQHPRYNAQNLAYHPWIQQVLASTPLKKRYLVLHPNGTIEHIDKIEHIVEKHPNYILLNAGSVAPKLNAPVVATGQNPVNPQQSVTPVVPAKYQANPVPTSPNAAQFPAAPVAPSASVVPAVAAVQSNPRQSLQAPTSGAATVPAAVAQANALPESSIPNPTPVAPVAPLVPANSNTIPASTKSAVAQANVDPVSSVTSAQATAPVNTNPVSPASSVGPSAQPTASGPDAPIPLPIIQDSSAPSPEPEVQLQTGSTALQPAPIQSPAILNGTVSAKPTGPPQSEPTPLPPAPIAQPPVILNTVVPGPKPTVLPPTGPTTTLPPVSAQTAKPPVILNGTVPSLTTQPPIWVTATATAVYPPPTTEPTTVTPDLPTVTTIPPVTATATAIATSAPSATTTPTATETPDSPTTVAPCTKPSDSNTDIDILHANTGAEPVVWFRTKDLDFWDKITSGNEVYDIVYFFNVPREQRVMKETKTTIHANGTVVEELTQTIYDDEDGTPPRVIKTTKVTEPDGSQSTS